MALLVETTDSLQDFDKLHEQYFARDFPLPESKHHITVVKTVKDDKGKVLASGFVKLFAEAIIVSDLASPSITRMKALDLLVKELMEWCKQYNVRQVHAFVSSNFSKILIQRYGFKHTKAVSLVMDVE